MTPLSQETLEKFESYGRKYFAHRKAEAPDVSQLVESMEYSYFNGGKRFRPQLCFAVGEALGLSFEQVAPLAMAVECIHTYSLIHDDLPCMDDDSERRGQPTNHIKYGEAMALLAGDALLTEAFAVLHYGYGEKAGKLVGLLATSAGGQGMIRGQVLDLGLAKPLNELSDLIHLHEMKTGELISLCFVGPALIKGQSLSAFKETGLMLGLAFQVKDDLLDIEEDDEASFIRFLGEEGSNDYLQSLTEKIHVAIQQLDLQSQFLTDLVNFNYSRDR